MPGAGRARKAANAAAETLQDVGEVFLGIAADRRKPPRVGTQIGGLRCGTARWTATGIRLRARPVRARRARQRLRPAVATGDDDRDRVR